MITWYGRFVRAEEQLEEYVSVSSAVASIYTHGVVHYKKEKRSERNLLFKHKDVSDSMLIYASVAWAEGTQSELFFFIKRRIHQSTVSTMFVCPPWTQ
jgi:hypothetical protein